MCALVHLSPHTKHNSKLLIGACKMLLPINRACTKDTEDGISGVWMAFFSFRLGTLKSYPISALKLPTHNERVL